MTGLVFPTLKEVLCCIGRKKKKKLRSIALQVLCVQSDFKHKSTTDTVLYLKDLLDKGAFSRGISEYGVYHRVSGNPERVCKLCHKSLQAAAEHKGQRTVFKLQQKATERDGR